MALWYDRPVKIRRGNVEAVLRDDVSEEELLWAAKDHEEPPERCRVIIKVDGNVVAEYTRTFDRPADDRHVSNFLKKMLLDPAYRAQYLASGSWNGVVVDDDPVNVATRSDVARINSRPMAKLRFKDFATLKVGGRDAFSSKHGTELDAAIPQASIAPIEMAFGSEEMRDQAKRWVARGLQVVILLIGLQYLL
jgi:hypothetical protein